MAGGLRRGGQIVRGPSFLSVLNMLPFLEGSVPAATAQGISVRSGNWPDSERQSAGRLPETPILLSATEPVSESWEQGQPEVLLMLVAVSEFDSESNAAACFDLLQSDMNATGVNGDPLPLADNNFCLDREYTTRVAEELRRLSPVDFSIVATPDGTLVHSVIGSTRGMAAHCDIARVVQSMAARKHVADPVCFQADGTSTGSLWDMKPAHEVLDRTFRGAIDVVDAAPFPA
jgi:hypothetical protein